MSNYNPKSKSLPILSAFQRSSVLPAPRNTQVDPTLIDAFFVVAREGNIDRIKTFMMDNKIPASVIDKNGDTALHHILRV